MKPVRKIAFALLAILLVVGVIVVVSSQTNLLVTTRTDRFTTTATSFVTVTSVLNHTTTVSVYENVEMMGNCTAVSYFLGDMQTEYATNSTVTQGNSTSYTLVITSVHSATVQTIGTKAYTTTAYANGTSVIITTSTLYDPNAAPSSGWTVTICTYHRPTTSSTTQTQGAATNPSLGLRLGLQISVNATGALSIQTNESNILNRMNNVTTTNDWPYSNTGSLPCGDYVQFPIEYAVLQGYYGKSNYTSASALTLYDPGVVYACPTMSAPIPYFLFAPLSDNTSFSFSSGQNDSYPLSADYSVTGYWTGSGIFHQFPPGVYPHW